MTTLPSMLGALTAILQSHLLCEKTTILETREFSHDQFYFKVRAELTLGYRFQVRVYTALGHKLRFFRRRKAQFVTVGIIFECQSRGLRLPIV